MSNMKKIIQFSISKGQNFYTAEAIGLPIFTQAATLDDLMVNIKEATDLYLENEDLSEFGFSARPSVLVNFEMPQYA